MNHLPVLPIVLPIATAALLVALAGARASRRRIVSLASAIVGCVASVMLAMSSTTAEHLVYRLGGWAAPFGIILVVDRLSGAMLVLADVVTLGALLHAVRGGDERSRHFHAFVHLQLAGVHGAFLTGDFFTLFVFFELLLMASYCLLLHGKGKRRIRSALHYVALNLVASAVFLAGVAVLYGATGALNMAAVARGMSAADDETRRLVSVAAALFAVVFALKAALVPLQFWLARVYASARPEVRASFSILTKVGVYCLVRLVTLLPAASKPVFDWLLPAALTTQVVGALAALLSREPARMYGHLLVTSVGVMVTGVALVDRGALPAALFYLAHSTIAIAAIFLVGGAPRAARSRTASGVAYVVAAMAVIGLPPLGGFLGKAALLAAIAGEPHAGVILASVLVSSAVALVAAARMGIAMFWAPVPPRRPRIEVGRGAAFAMLGTLGALAVFAGPAMDYAARAAAQLQDRTAYVRAVLGER